MGTSCVSSSVLPISIFLGTYAWWGLSCHSNPGVETSNYCKHVVLVLILDISVFLLFSSWFALLFGSSYFWIFIGWWFMLSPQNKSASGGYLSKEASIGKAVFAFCLLHTVSLLKSIAAPSQS